MLLEERIPDGWQPRIRNPGGLTLTTFQFTVLPVELGVKEEVRSIIDEIQKTQAEVMGATPTVVRTDHPALPFVLTFLTLVGVLVLGWRSR